MNSLFYFIFIYLLLMLPSAWQMQLQQSNKKQTRASKPSRVYPHPRRRPHSIVVVFPKPSEKLCARWQLHVEGTAAHVVVVPRVGRELLAQFVASMGIGPGISSDFLPERANLR